MPERLVYGGGYLFYAGYAVNPLGDGSEHIELVFDFVKLALFPAERGTRYLAGDEQHGGRGGVCGAESGGCVESAGAGNRHRDADLAGGAGVAVRHVGGSLLVPDVYEADVSPALVESVEGRHDLDAGQGEDGVYAFGD